MHFYGMLRMERLFWKQMCYRLEVWPLQNVEQNSGSICSGSATISFCGIQAYEEIRLFGYKVDILFLYAFGGLGGSFRRLKHQDPKNLAPRCPGPRDQQVSSIQGLQVWSNREKCCQGFSPVCTSRWKSLSCDCLYKRNYHQEEDPNKSWKTAKQGNTNSTSHHPTLTLDGLNIGIIPKILLGWPLSRGWWGEKLCLYVHSILGALQISWPKPPNLPEVWKAKGLPHCPSWWWRQGIGKGPPAGVGLPSHHPIFWREWTKLLKAPHLELIVRLLTVSHSSWFPFDRDGKILRTWGLESS